MDLLRGQKAEGKLRIDRTIPELTNSLFRRTYLF